jgi:ABC transport system ATP-binding/permease protein
VALLSVRNLDVRFGGPLLLNQAGFQIHSGEKVCIVGRNGEGKSTLMKIIAGELEPDGGEIIREKGLRVARMPQDIPVDLCGSIHTVVSNALAAHMPDYQVDIVLGQMDLDGSQLFENVSGGVKRRVLLACCLVQDPDILLLDEPTNHLDIPSIRWLEGFLAKFEKTILFITHDRTFLQKLATRILELDRGSVLDWDCGYQDFLQRRQDRWDAEEKQNALFDKRLAQEEAWIRKGIKARRTRNEGRVRALERMRQERGDRRERSGNVQMAVASAGNTGKLVLECKNVHFAWENAPLIQDFSSKIMRGDRVGIVGENGCGKTTLLNILLGKLQPNAGEVRHGTNLEVAYFDQHRHELREEETLAENIGNGKDTITINDRSRHVMSYLQDFYLAPSGLVAPCMC